MPTSLGNSTNSATGSAKNGVRPPIRNTRITGWGLVNSRRLGAADEEILKNVVGLTSEDVDAAWDYYREHAVEIDVDIRDNEAD